jgi:hypothetical protein
MEDKKGKKPGTRQETIGQYHLRRMDRDFGNLRWMVEFFIEHHGPAWYIRVIHEGVYGTVYVDTQVLWQKIN